MFNYINLISFFFKNSYYPIYFHLLSTILLLYWITCIMPSFLLTIYFGCKMIDIYSLIGRERTEQIPYGQFLSFRGHFQVHRNPFRTFDLIASLPLNVIFASSIPLEWNVGHCHIQLNVPPLNHLSFLLGNQFMSSLQFPHIYHFSSIVPPQGRSSQHQETGLSQHLSLGTRDRQSMARLPKRQKRLG